MAKITLSHNPPLEGLVDLRTDIAFAEPDGKRLALQLLKPQWASGGKGFPLVIFIQGSGWTKPNQFWQLPQLSLLARQGYVIASVTHRAHWEAPAPAFLQDVKSAIRFLRAHAAEYDIDKERVCAWGTSSGGNTALLLGLTGDDPSFSSDVHPEESSAVKAVVDCFGPTDMIKMAEVQYKGILDDPQSRFRSLGGLSETDCRSVLRSISPIEYLRPGLTLPPIMILHGDADPVVLWEDSEAFYEKLTALGHEADLVRVTEAPHEGTFWSLPLLEVIFGFIRKHL